MSAGYWLEVDLPGMSEPLQVGQNHNCTYNLGPMLRAAGFPQWAALLGAPASEVGGVLTSVADELRRAPDRYRQYNPANGWGSYEGALEFLNNFAGDCALNSAARIGGSL